MALCRFAPLVALAACVLAPTVAAAESPASRVASITATARAQHSVHYVSVRTQGDVTLTIDCDAGKAAGIQRITYREGRQTGHLTVIVAGRTAYMRGDVYALTRFLGFPAANANKVAGTWIRIRHTASAYVPIAEDVTFASAMSDLKPIGRLANVPRTKLAGEAVVGVRGTTRVQGKTVVDTVWASAAAKPLLVSQVTRGPGFSITITYSRWNKPVHVKAPLDFIDSETGKSSGTVA